MNIYILEKENNVEISEHLKHQNYNVVEKLTDLHKCSVVIVSKVKKVQEALEIIDVGLGLGLDVICMRQPQYNFVCNLLIQDGAFFV